MIVLTNVPPELYASLLLRSPSNYSERKQLDKSEISSNKELLMNMSLILVSAFTFLT